MGVPESSSLHTWSTGGPRRENGAPHTESSHPDSSSTAVGAITDTLRRRSNGLLQQVSATQQPTEKQRHAHNRKKRSNSSLFRSWKRFATKHTWTIPLIMVLSILSLYVVNPTESNVLHHFLYLSYAEPQLDGDSPTQYGKGLWDIAFVSFYVIVLSFTREFIMQELLRPLARAFGIRARGKQQRFMEQMYTVIYFGFSGSAGLYVMRNSPVWYFNTKAMYEGYPHRTHDAEFKFYYLFQSAYWAQQGIVMLLGMEKPRKDFKELVAHHLVTLALIGLSYRFHFTYMGIAIYITHDISDFFLALSKSLHYINSPLVGVSFIQSIIAWIYLRHYLNIRILFSILTEFRTVGPYELNWETQQYKCLLSNVITFSLIAALQLLNLFWLYCLLRSLYQFVVLRVAKDDRSEDEEEEIEEEAQDKVVERGPETAIESM